MFDPAVHPDEEKRKEWLQERNAKTDYGNTKKIRTDE
jgi:hypothetical protein